eukprot:51338-Pyramimonas_sp.AAC.1
MLCDAMLGYDMLCDAVLMLPCAMLRNAKLSEGGATGGTAGRMLGEPPGAACTARPHSDR